jgi:hypothetical protein
MKAAASRQAAAQAKRGLVTVAMETYLAAQSRRRAASAVLQRVELEKAALLTRINAEPEILLLLETDDAITDLEQRGDAAIEALLCSLASELHGLERVEKKREENVGGERHGHRLAAIARLQALLRRRQLGLLSHEELRGLLAHDDGTAALVDGA